MTMSWDGTAMGRPLAGDRMLWGLSIRIRASAWASADSGRCTAIWSPSKSALNAAQTSGWIWMALPSTRIGSNAWMPRRWRVGARFRKTGCSLMTSSRTSHTCGRRPLHHPLGGLDVLGVLEVDEPLHHERLEQLERHLLGQAALVQAQLGADHDDRAARVVDALAQQVLAEPALLALEHVGERLERAVARARDGPAAAAVVEQRVDGLLQHPLLVVHDDLGRAEVEEPLQPVVAVDDPAVEVVEVGRREPAAVELHHRAQVGRDDRHGVEDHRGGRVDGRPSASRRLNAETTLSRLMALALRWPLAVSMTSRRKTSSASRSRRAMRSLTASAPMPPVKYSWKRSCSSRQTRSSSTSCLGASVRNVS